MPVHSGACALPGKVLTLPTYCLGAALDWLDALCTLGAVPVQLVTAVFEALHDVHGHAAVVQLVWDDQAAWQQPQGL